MRDIFADIFAGPPADPVEAVRRTLRAPPRRRFYQQVSVADGASEFAVLLDQRPVRTPARRPLAAPSHALALALAAEWAAQQNVIDPAKMPLTRLANAIVDGVAFAQREVAAGIAEYLGTDLVCYRAEQPADLVACQAQAWDPLIAWADETLGARFVLAQGVTYVHQPADALAAAARAIPGDPWRLGAVQAITTLTGSALIALALANGRLSADEAWASAHVDEDWNMAQWGRDEIALARRAFRFAELQAAARLLDLIAR